MIYRIREIFNEGLKSWLVSQLLNKFTRDIYNTDLPSSALI